MKRTPRDQAESERRITRRGLILAGAQLGVVGILVARMRHLQLEQSSEFRLLAEENRINVRLLPPPRGRIFDRNGEVLADNEQLYRIVIVREDAGDVDEVLARLARLLPLETEDIERVRAEIYRRSPFVPVTVAERLHWEDVAEVAVNTPALPGVNPEVGLSRVYPLGEDFAHVVGYVGPVSDYDLSRIENPDPLLQIPRYQIGKTGVEAKLEDALRGRAGTRRIEVNAVGRVMRELDRQPGQPGADVELTIDAGLQNFVQARLGRESASAVVLDTETGDILALASSPSFDPNKFVRGISVADYRALTDTPLRPLANKAVQGTYPPGSTFKMVVALAALEEGVIKPEETVWCPGYKELGRRRFHCWKRGGHGHVNLIDSLEQSCDVYYYEVAEKVGIEKIAAMARRLGLGAQFNLPLSAVARGLTPDKDWKRRNRGADWLIGDTLNAGIGQGYVLASPLQLAVMTARLASGRALEPRLVRRLGEAEQPPAPARDLGIDPGHLRLVRRGMLAVTNNRRGTAWSSRVELAEMKIAGKTGTSQVRNISAAERESGVLDNDEVPWEQRDHALFVAFAPYDAPRLACSVVVEHGGGGSTAAAPIARDIMLAALSGGMPPLEAYPAAQRREIGDRLRALNLRQYRNGEDGRGRSRA
ncbi:penicillin-binding protein 2 [Meinhardsimonia xiamenensis]|jgi:penicillin-binding protein 2|uniref:Penicillin-binding protein 2 n=1 Tax=Meinhardsimonia xiamenensis TaxID=990712 RepID=A0A1G9EDE5_9RHOB|nr:penicillin-binding protein 2 [Meinhardsimonia xiamenensis]PRX33819.1 penicillin-binding protein 2 [Meinhardsimonia xiamenensis]SDK74134.1 penicillin-binding protein 2 [Meinhardsimonia xiamenensis]